MSKASEYKKRLAEKPSPTAEITLPSGAVFTCRRPPLPTWIAAGRIPQSFVRQLLKTQNKEGAIPDLDTDETMQIMAFIAEAILYAVVDPKLVLGTKNENEFDPANIDPDDFQFLTTWIMEGSPGVPVETKGGEIAVDNLSQFRQKRGSGGALGVSPDGAEIRDEAEPVAAIG